MSTLAKINPNKKKSKKAMSIIIGYVLLITFAAVIGVIVYKWQKTYVPQDSINCPEGSSLFIINKTYDCNANTLTFWIKNNGQFAVGGYFIYVKDDPDKEIATVNIYKNNTDMPSPIFPDAFGISGVKLGMVGGALSLDNQFEPGAIEEETYTLVGIEDIYSIEIVPIRFQVEKNRQIIASCKDVRIKEEVGGAAGCYEECVSINPCGSRVCGTVMDNCYEEFSCPPGCGIGEFCNSTGRCVTPTECEYTCSSLGYICGTWRICGEDINCDNPGCNEGLGEICNSVGKCVIGGSTCDGSWNPPETLDVLCDGPGVHCLLSCVCEPGYVPVGDGSCIASGAGVGCLSYCQTLGLGYTDSTCVGPPGQCRYTFNGDLYTNGNYLCTNPLTPLCCCAPAV